MQVGLRVTSHPPMLPSEIVFEPRVTPLGGGSLLVTLGYGRIKGRRKHAPSLEVHDRRRTQVPTRRMDEIGVIGGVHPVIAGGDPLTGLLAHRNRSLTIVHRTGNFLVLACLMAVLSMTSTVGLGGRDSSILGWSFGSGDKFVWAKGRLRLVGIGRSL